MTLTAEDIALGPINRLRTAAKTQALVLSNCSVGPVASCVAYVVGRFCARHDIPREGLSVNAEWTMAENPHPVGYIDLAIRLLRALRRMGVEKVDQSFLICCRF